MYIIGNKFNSKAQQIDENTKDIAELKEIVKTPAIIYDASVEISSDAGTVNSSDVIQTIGSIENAFILDTIGSLFRIIDVVDGVVYIMYVSSIRGVPGATGENGADGVSVVDVKILQDGVEDGQNKYKVYVYLSNDNIIDAGTIKLNNPQVSWNTPAIYDVDLPSAGTKVRYFVNGNICHLLLTPFQFNSGLTIPNGQIVYTGLPNPQTFVDDKLQFECTTQDDATKPAIRLAITNDGNLIFDESTSLVNNNHKFYGSLTYIINN